MKYINTILKQLHFFLDAPIPDAPTFHPDVWSYFRFRNNLPNGFSLTLVIFFVLKYLQLELTMCPYGSLLVDEVLKYHSLVAVCGQLDLHTFLSYLSKILRRMKSIFLILKFYGGPRNLIISSLLDETSNLIDQLPN